MVFFSFFLNSIATSPFCLYGNLINAMETILVILGFVWFRGYPGTEQDDPSFTGVWFGDTRDGVILHEEYSSISGTLPFAKNTRASSFHLHGVNLRLPPPPCAPRTGSSWSSHPS